MTEAKGKLTQASRIKRIKKLGRALVKECEALDLSEDDRQFSIKIAVTHAKQAVLWATRGDRKG
jgi:hypothetical protein